MVFDVHLLCGIGQGTQKACKHTSFIFTLIDVFGASPDVAPNRTPREHVRYAFHLSIQHTCLLWHKT
jgi:hypothetical protein